MAVFPALHRPIVGAPMAGGASTPSLAVAVSDAGGLGFLAAGYKTVDAVRDQVAEVRRRTDAPFGVNVFVPSTVAGPTGTAVAAYRRRLEADAARLGVTLGEAPADDEDSWDAKIALLAEDPVPVVSFTFGCPPPEVIGAMHRVGSCVLVTVTSVHEAGAATRAGADALVLQGVEAGAHRGSFVDSDDEDRLGLLPLLRLVAGETALPLVAAGGVADGAGVAATLCAGASAAQLGTALLRCPEAGTSAPHRAALAAGGRSTALTRAFTGRTARGLVNQFVAEHSAEAPAAYPQVHHLTSPLRRAARDAGDVEHLHLWAGQAYALGREVPAADLVEALTDEAAAAMRGASSQIDGV